MTMFRIAVRNLWRNPRRSLITLSAVAIGVWALIFVWAFIDGVNEQMIANNIQYLTGHVKVHRAGYHQDRVLALSLVQAQPTAIVGLPQVAAVAPRVEGFALASTLDTARTVMVYGVAHDQEVEVTSLHRAVVSGEYLSGAPGEILLGDDLARELNVEVGQTVDLIVQAADGSLGANRFRLRGLYNSGIEQLDEALVVIPLESAQDLYSMPGRITSWVVRLDDRRAVDGVLGQLKGELGQNYEVYDWTRLLPGVVQAVAFHEAIGYIVLLVVFVVVTAGIANTLLMSVVERQHEFGVLRAIGTQSSSIVSLVLWESLALAFVGLLLGNLAGVAFTGYWSIQGMDLSMYTAAMETMPGLSGVVYPMLRLDHLILISVVIFTVCPLPAIFPAWRTARLSPVDAIAGVAHQTHSNSRLERSIRFPVRAIWLQLAWRSLFRNPRRSLITGGTTAFGMAAFVFLYALVDGFFEQMIRNSTDLLSAHIQVSSLSGSREESTFDRSLLEGSLRDVNIAFVSARVTREVVISTAHRTATVTWLGVDADAEQHVTRLHQFIEEGAYLAASKPGIVIGRKLASDLNVGAGQKVIVTGQDETGSLVSEAVRVAGIYATGSELFDGGYAFSPIEALRALYGLDPGEVSYIAIRLVDPDASRSVAESLSAALSAKGLKAEPWEKVLPVVTQMIEMSRVDFYLILLVIFVVVGLGVLNTMQMSVLERLKEFGMQIALGTESAQLMRMIMYESFMLGTIGIIIGAVVGAGLAQYFHIRGIDLSAFTSGMAAIPGLTDRVSPVVIWSHLVAPGVLLFAIGIAASIYPAMKAARLDPVDALHD